MFRLTANLLFVALFLLFLSSCEFMKEINRKESNELCRKGYDELKLKHYTQAFEDYNKAVAVDSTNPFAWQGRGASKFHMGEMGGAWLDEVKAHSLDSNLRNILSWMGQVSNGMKLYSRGKSLYTRSIARGGDRLTGDYLGRAVSEYHLNEYAEAIIDINRAIAMDDNVEYGHYWRGVIDQAMKKYGEAKVEFTISLKRYEKSAKIYEWKASAEYYTEEYDSALADFNSAMGMDSTLKVHSFRAMTKMKLADTKGAEEDFKLSITKDYNGFTPKDFGERAVDEYYLRQYDSALHDINVALQDTSLNHIASWKDSIENAMKNGHRKG